MEHHHRSPLLLRTITHNEYFIGLSLRLVCDRLLCVMTLLHVFVPV